MSSYVIITDSSADLPISMIEQYGIEVAQLSVTLEGEQPRPNNEVDPKYLYNALRDKRGAKTAAANAGTFTEVFEKYLSAGTDVLYLGFSSGLSATFQGSRIAAADLCEKYPDRTIATVDTLCAALGQGLIVYLAAKKKAEGADLATVKAYVEGLLPNLAHWFTVDDLFFLKRGGRVSAATAVVGSLLQIKPVMHVDNEGHLIKVTTARGRKGSLDALCARMKESMLQHPDQTVFIGHGDCLADAEYLAGKIKTETGVEVSVIDYVGPVIGAHAGPGVVALFFLGKER
jgi:DegV family protein with EDD domain